MVLIVSIYKKQYKHIQFNSTEYKYPYAANNKNKSLGKYLNNKLKTDTEKT
jgi:hypothetical protein